MKDHERCCIGVADCLGVPYYSGLGCMWSMPAGARCCPTAAFASAAMEKGRDGHWKQTWVAAGTGTLLSRGQSLVLTTGLTNILLANPYLPRLNTHGDYIQPDNSDK